MSGRDFTSVWRASARPVRRDQLLRAAITLLVDRGLPDSSIDDIAAQAGVAKGSFYQYFANRADLMDTLHQHFVDAFQAPMAAAVEARAPDGWNGRFAAFNFHALYGMADDALTAGGSTEELGALTAQLSQRLPGG